MLMKQQLLGLRSHRTRLWFVVEPPKSHSSTDMFGMFETTRQFCLEGNHIFLDCEAIKTMTNATRMLCQSLSKQAFKHVGIALVHPCPSSSSPQSTQKPYGYGSIPIHTIFRGMNIHLPAILMFTRGIGF
jgi:hypothetical protein